MDEDQSPEELRVRNVRCEAASDYVNSFSKSGYKPLPSDFRVPLIKIYGILENGEKCLANIHCVLPYFLLRTRSPFSEELKSHVGRIIVKCAKLLNHNFIQGYPLLADVVPFELKDMYGYYENPDHFVKVIFYDVILCHRIGIMLQKECGKSELLQPYSTHIPYMLQFFIDYDIFGMGIVKFKNMKFRSSTEKTKDLFQNIEPSNLLPSSIMEVEFDVLEKDIVKEIPPNLQNGDLGLQNPGLRNESPKLGYQCSGLEFIWKEERLRCRMTKTPLPEVDKPEVGVPVFENDREKSYFLQLKKILKNLENDSLELSQVHSNAQIFSQTEIEENNPKKVEEYIDSQETEEYQEDNLEVQDNYETYEDNDEKIQSEMTQVFNDESNDDVIVLDDEPELIDLTDLKDKPKFIEVEPDYPPVLVNPQVCLFSRQKSNQKLT